MLFVVCVCVCVFCCTIDRFGKVLRVIVLLLVPWKLLRMLFYCFSCPMIGQSRVIPKVEWNVVFQEIFFAPYVAETIGVTKYAASLA